MQENKVQLEEATGMSLPSDNDSEVPTEDFDYGDFEATPKLDLTGKTPFTIKFLKSKRDLTCTCRSGDRSPNDGNVEKFIEGKLGDLEEI